MRNYIKYQPRIGEEPITIKIRVDSGCFHRECSPIAYSFIDQELSKISDNERHFDFVEHESGPEIIAWIAVGTAGISLATSLVNLITAIINARAKGRKAGDRPNGDLRLVIRDTYRTDSSTEEFVMEIYDKDMVTPEQVKDAIEHGIQRRKV